MTTGRPSKLTPELLDQLDALADDVWSIADACAHLGIHDSTWRAWRSQGDKDIAAELDTDFSRFSLLAARVGAPKRRALAWSTLRTILETERGEFVRSPDGFSHEWVPGPSDAAKVSAALGLLRLDQAAKVEVTGADGGPMEVVTNAARDLHSRMDSLAARIAAQRAADESRAD